MADQSNDKTEATAPVADAQEAPANKSKSPESAAKADAESKEDTKPADESTATEDSKKSAENANEKTSTDDGDVEMKDAREAQATEEAPDESSAQPVDGESAPASATTPAGKGKGRRKSAAGDVKGKGLNRKNSKARLTHLDAKPGDHFLVKLKGFPAWPAIICDESMLPQALVTSRPVTAARPDGKFAELYADGGKRAHDRSFPVMYLHTNEFGWVSNTALTELTPEKAEETITEKMRKDLKEAFQLAAKNHPVEHYKAILKKFQDELIAQEEARKEAAATPKKSKKGKSKASDEDVDMSMADAEDAEEKPKSKKRKADEDISTPQRPDSVKKPKIKLNTSTPKANGTPKATDESATKSKTKMKTKSKKSGDKKADTPKMTPEERRNRKEMELLYLRHKLQRGLLSRDKQPQESDMKSMSDYITMLENFQELEASIIRGTKINKVLKEILKLASIPCEEEYNFKDRSKTLLDKWNKMLAEDPTPAATNGVNGKSTEKKSEANGVKEAKEGTEEPKAAESEKTEKVETKPDAEEVEEKSASDEVSAPPEPVEAAA